MTGNIWGGQQSLPHSWADFPSEFNTLTECRYMQNEADAVKRPSFYVNNYVLFLAKKKSPSGNKNEEVWCCVLMFWTFLCCLFITLVTLDWFGGAVRGNNFKKSCNTEALRPNGHTAVPLIALRTIFPQCWATCTTSINTQQKKFLLPSPHLNSTTISRKHKGKK